MQITMRRLPSLDFLVCQAGDEETTMWGPLDEMTAMILFGEDFIEAWKVRERREGIVLAEFREVSAD